MAGIPKPENAQRNLTEEDIRLEFAPTGSGAVNDNSDECVVDGIPYSCKKIESRKKIKVKLDNIIDESVFIFVDIEACGNIVEQITYPLFLTDIMSVSKERVLDSLFIVNDYALFFGFIDRFYFLFQFIASVKIYTIVTYL